MIDLYAWGTPNGRKVSIALEELWIPFKVHMVDITKGEQFENSFLAMNPNNKIPVIVDPKGPQGKKITLCESGAILIYLADKTGKLLPPSGVERHETIQWLMFQMGGIGPMFGQTHHFRRYAPQETYGLQRYTTETHRLYKVLDGRLAKSEYVAGNEYSIADIAIYPWVARFELHQIAWEAIPNVKRWYDSIGSRTAVRRGMEILS
ncbi:Disulfide-bond oxidoreductase YfcG [Paraburkholderia hiiakae]|uniref:Disulfide-bond oxidoreductase YfcG n=1 Tax=Paraburkholderia hiiakae TaxID=1081782 RepID=A0ABN7I4B4_9BURK|nr:glutathione S-transferase N-terminal domain-containing protein [Paraburkholderia hiiakae]CAD6544878.1 Disulfide-bond oxidoreductase YfcG [Paraburkholderia hiiakae]